MGKIVGHRWICDGCLDEPSHKGGDMPKGWGEKAQDGDSKGDKNG